MNFPLFARVLGLLLLLESLALFSCAAFSVFDGGWENSASFALTVTTGVALLSGLVLTYFGRGDYDRIPRREATMIVGAGWTLSALIGSIPFLLAEPGLEPAAAFFESVSGFTTTGSTVIADLDAWPRGVLLWRSMSQWFGGLGILVLFVALLSSLGAGTRSLFRNESSFEASDVSNAKIRDTALLLWKIYTVLTLICFAGLKVLGMTWFDAGCHAMTTLATGGFSTHNESIGFFSGWRTGLAIEIWLSVFMLIGSISFLIYVVILRRIWDRLRKEEEARWYLWVIVSAIGIITAIQLATVGGDFGETLRGTVFTVISIISSTGFGTVDFEQWPMGTHLILMLLMLVGGCAGSTAGGAKISRVMLLIRSTQQEIVTAFRPGKVFRMQVNGNSIKEETRSQTILHFALYGFIACISMAVVAILETAHAVDLETVTSSVLTCLSNIGPGFGAIGPTDNFSHFREITLFYLSLLMLLGRLELFAFLVLFAPSAWRKF